MIQCTVIYPIFRDVATPRFYLWGHLIAVKRLHCCLLPPGGSFGTWGDASSGFNQTWGSGARVLPRFLATSWIRIVGQTGSKSAKEFVFWQFGGQCINLLIARSGDLLSSESANSWAGIFNPLPIGPKALGIYQDAKTRTSDITWFHTIWKQGSLTAAAFESSKINLWTFLMSCHGCTADQEKQFKYHPKMFINDHQLPLISQYISHLLKSMEWVSKHHMVVSWNRGTPESSIVMGFSNKNHPFFGGTPMAMEPPQAWLILPVTSCTTRSQGIQVTTAATVLKLFCGSFLARLTMSSGWDPSPGCGG